MPQLELVKFGPWGGDGGKPRDIKMVPYHLDTVTISSGVTIDSIEFSYTDHDGQYHNTGPWGGHGGHNDTVSVMNRINFCLLLSLSLGLSIV